MYFTFSKCIKAHQVDGKARLTSYCSSVFPTAWSLRLLYINQRIILYLNSFHQVYCTHLDYHHSIRTLSLCAHAHSNQSKKARILQIYLLYIFLHSRNKILLAHFQKSCRRQRHRTSFVFEI